LVPVVLVGYRKPRVKEHVEVTARETAEDLTCLQGGGLHREAFRLPDVLPQVGCGDVLGPADVRNSDGFALAEVLAAATAAGLATVVSAGRSRCGRSVVGTGIAFAAAA